MDDNFKKKIAQDFGLSSMDNEEQERLIEKIGNLLFESVIERSVDAMDESSMNEFDEVLSGAGTDYQKVLGFLKSNVTGFETIVSEEMSRLKKATSGIFE